MSCIAQGSSAQYSILNGTTWQRGNSPGGGGKSTNSIGLAADGNRVFAVWSITRNDNVHVINYNQGDNGNWGTTQTISPAGEYGDNPQPSSIKPRQGVCGLELWYESHDLVA